MTSSSPLNPFATAVAAYESGRFAESEAACRELLASNPQHIDALHLLALSLAALESAEAPDVLRRALAIRKKDPGLWLALGDGEARAGNEAAAAEAYRAALRAAPGYVPAHISLGRLHFAGGRYVEAATALRRGLEIDDDGMFGRDADLWNKLGYALSRQTRISDAIAAYRQALSHDPHHVGALANLALALLETGETQDAVANYESAVALAPERADLHSNLLLALNDSTAVSAEQVWRRSQDWDRAHGQVARLPAFPRPAPDGRLHIGYVLGDLQSPAMAPFLLPLLAGHRRDRVRVTCYSNTAPDDAATEQLRRHTDLWHDIRALSDDAAARAIAIDGIDVLIDLSGHAVGNRLGIFARKPAPLQASWLGYPNTTGLSAIDLRLTDEIADPSDEGGRWHSERLLRLPNFFCYEAPRDAPAVAPLPALANGFVTLGSFSNSMKVTPATAALWAEILTALPTAHLLLNSPLFADDGIRARYESLFTQYGIASNRLELLCAVAEPCDRLALYGRVDIALDSFPYNSATATCEALWMGVPVITRLGERHAGRVGASLLSAAGLPQLIARTTTEYKAKVIVLAAELASLAELREGLRNQVAASLLCDGPAFAARFEEALSAALAAKSQQV